MKKLVAVALIGAMMFAIAGCSDGNSKSKKKSKNKDDSIEKVIDEDESSDKKDKNDKKDFEDMIDYGVVDIIEESSPVVVKNFKSQNYLNENGGTEGVSFIMQDVDNDGNNIFIGVKGQGLDAELIANNNDVSNGAIKVSEVNMHYLELHLGDEYYSFEQMILQYENEDGVELLDKHEVEYQDGDYYITGSNIDKYILYYKYGNFSWGDNPMGNIYALRMGFSDTVEEAKEKLNANKERFEIVPFTDEETINKVDYKKYTCFNDLVMNLLNSYGLYVDTYELISYNSRIEIHNDPYAAEIEIENGHYDDLEEFYSFDLNGLKLYIDGRNVKYNLGDKKIEIYCYLPYDVEYTNENIEDEIRSFFS